MNDAERTAVAAELARAEAERTAVPPLVDRYPAMDVVDAYHVQLHNIRGRLERGASIVGHKVGLSSAAMQRMMGVDEPDYGHLLDDMRLQPGEAVATSRFLQPRVEVEVAIVLGEDLPGGSCSIDDVVHAVDHVAAAIELIDSRIADWRIGIVDTIADNASSAGFALGCRKVSLDEIDDIRLTGALLWRNGELVETGAAGAVLGNPLRSVAWLANKIADFGVQLKAGDIVLPGSCTRAIDVRPGDEVIAEFDRLGDVRLEFE